MPSLLHTCNRGYENCLTRETLHDGGMSLHQGNGWIINQTNQPAPDHLSDIYNDLAFAHLTLQNPIAIAASSVNALIKSMVEMFLVSIKGEDIISPWYLYFTGTAMEGLTHRIALTRKLMLQQIQRKVSRVGRLVETKSLDHPGCYKGFFGFFTDYGHVYCGQKLWYGGQRRMRDDRNAPSRSYLKIEEAYKIFGIKPCESESVVDLGAAPGGWSYSAARHGAQVIAVDNGNLKGGASQHPAIEHIREDAWTFVPDHHKTIDWLFCDLIDNPYEVLGLIRKWLSNQWCQHFIFNAKFGRTDPLQLIAQINSSDKGLKPLCDHLIIRHLYHDRDELTVMGRI